ncbi:MAG: hypothetical protein ACLRWF_11785 [Ruthenibacterium sp.]
MEKIIRWSCFTASACIVAAFLFALYISTLLPDTFHVGAGEIRVAGILSPPALGQKAAAKPRAGLTCAAFAGCHR